MMAIRLSLIIFFFLLNFSEYRSDDTNGKKRTESSGMQEIWVPKNNSLEAKCDNQVNILVNSLYKYEKWALKMFDASSKIPSGLLAGKIKDLGMYDECVAINVTVNNETIRGQHCMYTLNITFNGTNRVFSPTLSVCLPATCKEDQVKKKMQELINTSFLGHKEIRVTQVTCSEVDDHWELGAVITLCVIGALLTFLLICTTCDVLSQITSINSNFVNTLSKFSFINNGKRILSMNVNENSLPIIASLKFYSMCGVILGHRFLLSYSGSVLNIEDTDEWLHTFGAAIVFSVINYVDTFLVITGFLTSYLFLKGMAKGRKFNLLAYYVHRYMRLTPSFMALLSIATYILPKIGSGALWQSTKIQSDCCKEKWWAKLLYIHNYVYSHDLRCLVHTWYLAVDMQLFWVSPLIIYPLYKKHKLGLIILSTAIVASVITPAVIEALNKYQLYFFTDEKYDHETLLHFYVLTSNRIGPWLLGILTGYLLATDHGIPTPGLRKIGWILAVLAFAYSLFTYRIYQQEYYQSNIYFETFNAGVGKHIWAFGICWIIYISLVGEGGIICQFLSFPMYLPLGRISYSIYLLHYVVQTMEIKSVRVPMYINEFQMVNFHVSDLVICIFGGFVFCLMFESPFLVIEKLIFTHVTGRISQSSVENETNNPKKYSKE